MKLNHIHLAVLDLPSALAWLGQVWNARAGYHNDRMASVPLNGLTLILDAADHDAPATLGFSSDDCDGDFRRVVARGAVVLEEPSDRPWGVRAAYLKGPGGLTFEIEQAL